MGTMILYIRMTSQIPLLFHDVQLRPSLSLLKSCLCVSPCTRPVTPAGRVSAISPAIVMQAAH